MRLQRASAGDLVAILAILALILGAVLSPRASAAFKYLQEGMTAPELSGEDLSTGKTISVEVLGDEEDAVLVITFWATWSERSLEILRDLKGMVEEYADRPFRVVAVNVDGEHITGPVRSEIERIVHEMELPFPVLLDENLENFYSYGVVAVPSTAVLDSKGILRFAPAGYSYLLRDKLVDSTQVLLGIKDRHEVLELEPAYIPTPRASRYYNLALQMMRKRLYERALAHLEKSVAADSGFSAPFNLRGQILLQLGRPEEAAVEFDHAVALAESSVAAWAGWGRSLLRTGRSEEALEKLTAALALDEFYAPAMIDRAVCLLQNGQEEEALALLDSARELDPKNPSIHFTLGRHYESTGKTADALTAYRNALEALYPAP